MSRITEVFPKKNGADTCLYNFKVLPEYNGRCTTAYTLPSLSLKVETGTKYQDPCWMEVNYVF